MVAREAGARVNQADREINKVDTLAASKALRRLRDVGLFASRTAARPLGTSPSPECWASTTRQETSAALARPSLPLSLLPKELQGWASPVIPAPLASNLGPQDSSPRHPDQRDHPLGDSRRRAVLNEPPGA